MGLWVIQRGGASLLVLVTAVALPLQQLVLCTPALLGAWAEAFFWGDAVALGFVLVGFGLYQGLAPEGRAARGSLGEEDAALTAADSPAAGMSTAMDAAGGSGRACAAPRSTEHGQ